MSGVRGRLRDIDAHEAQQAEEPSAPTGMYEAAIEYGCESDPSGCRTRWPFDGYDKAALFVISESDHVRAQGLTIYTGGVVKLDGQYVEVVSDPEPDCARSI